MRVAIYSRVSTTQQDDEAQYEELLSSVADAPLLARLIGHDLFLSADLANRPAR